MAKVSVIIPVYNVEKYLRKCLDSVINQTLEDLEIILVDDESPDNCPQICDEYTRKDSRVKVIHQKNNGASYCRNLGVQKATSEYIVFIDSDDWVNKEYIESLYDDITNTKADFSFCNAHMVSNDKTEITNYKQNLKNNTFTLLENRLKLINLPMFNSPWAKIYRKNLLINNNINFLKEDGYNGFGEDFLFIIKSLYCANLVTYAPGAMYYYNRLNEESVCSLPERQHQNDLDRIIIINKIFEFLNNKNVPKSVQSNVLIYSLEFLNWATLDIIKKFVFQMDNTYSLFQKYKFYRLYTFRLIKDGNILKRIFSIENQYKRNFKVKILRILGYQIVLKEECIEK